MGNWYSFETKSDSVTKQIRRALGKVHCVIGGSLLTYGFIGNGESNWLRKMEGSMSVTVRHSTLPEPVVSAPCGLELLDKKFDRGQTLLSTHTKRCKSCRSLRAQPVLPPPEEVIEVPVIRKQPGDTLARLTHLQDQALELASTIEVAVTAFKAVADAEEKLKELEHEAETQREVLRQWIR